jgi:hypothetical protein
VGIHLAAEHAPEFEAPHAVLDGADFAFDVAGGRFVVLGLRQGQQLAGVAHGARGAVQLAGFIGQARALAAQFLGAFRLVPDGGVFELARNFFEPLFL